MTVMNFLVFLDPYAGELEKILSGLKYMLVSDLAQAAGQPISPGDSLYFLRSKDEYTLRVKATIVRVQFFTNCLNEDLSQILKELQPRLQLTEDQYNYWATKEQVMLVEFDQAHKTELIHVAANKITDRSDWIAFKELSQIT
jgi:hypothetical protein